MKKLTLLNVCLAATIGQSAWAGTMGDVATCAINPGFIVGVEGGAAYSELPNIGLINTVLGSITGGGTTAVTSIKDYTGTLGGFVGYKFPISPNFAFEPMVGYHYIWAPSLDLTVSAVTPIGPIPVAVVNHTSNLNLVDLTIQGNYRLDNGWNFFVQPGFAVVMNKVTLSLGTMDSSTPPVFNAATSSSTVNALRPEVGVGFGAMVTDHVNLYAKYTYIKGNDLNAALPLWTPNLSTVQLGLSYEA